MQEIIFLLNIFNNIFTKIKDNDKRDKKNKKEISNVKISSINNFYDISFLFL